jgi:hypothetical protein
MFLLWFCAELPCILNTVFRMFPSGQKSELKEVFRFYIDVSRNEDGRPTTTFTVRITRLTSYIISLCEMWGFTATGVNRSVLWDLGSCSLIGMTAFREAPPKRRAGYTVLHSRRQPCSNYSIPQFDDHYFESVSFMLTYTCYAYIFVQTS